MARRLRTSIGPGFFITAAFIGPGTVTTCTIAGADFGYVLLWTLLFAVIATYVLQEMSGRIGLIGGMGLGEALYRELPGRVMRIIGIIIVLCAIGIGNAAYQTGNILGATLGLSSLTGIEVVHVSLIYISLWPVIIGVISFLLLWFGTYKSLEKVFTGFVAIMSLCFIVTAVMIKPDFISLIKGMFLPRLTENNLYIALGLVGTTIPPYNFFLYASIIKEKWSDKNDLSAARLDIFTAVLVGGIISMAIVVTASAAFFGTNASITGAGDMAVQLEPLLGTWAKLAIAIGLFGAGMSSAMTAPLAAGYAISGTFLWNSSLKNTRFRIIWCSVLFIGVFFASIGLKPVPAIIFAQVANGIILPVVAMFLLYIMNNKRLLGEHVNSLRANVIGGIIILITIVLGARGIVQLF
ncbi:manganese transporter [bacterium SM23_31]|nr:MAG: manganese transporter [bacterium SM23_31]